MAAAMRVTAMHVQETDGGGDDTMTCVQERAAAAGNGDADARSNTAEIDGASAAQIDRAAEVRGLIGHNSRSNFADDAMKDPSHAHHRFSSDDENLEDCMNEENDSGLV
ncbi:hypothetical protein OsJ_05656 [Oryza sativa Japonica Group]|uniref:Uncharacterized protein n=1 Tax=Oryza sativa subsp. japonica TaxID=39947 RepID=Q6ZIH8_ORYSJ|nr:hypothetical protein OsJ_05656 [Oryza sativa Japonica Group]BAD15432.1 hypothetical protein [Oryza sativa Japonica Group]